MTWLLFCRATRMYYGGEPPAWTLTPSIPPEALYREATATQPPVATGPLPDIVPILLSMFLEVA